LARRATHQPRILLAEDEPGIMFTFKAILEDAGFLVDSASSFQEARNAVRKGSYDAVITDFSLERNGLGMELAREAKQRQPAPAILLYSGQPTVQDLRHALALPVDYFAFKPVDLDEIKVAITRLVARRADGPPMS
jgi:DNA-binding response OmpR family regulator